MSKKQINHRERGVAIFYILAGVVLFGALTFSFMRSVNTTKGSSNKGQIKVIAQDIMRYASSLEKAVERLRLANGCSENDISFYSTEWATPSDYDNTNTPFAGGDFNCHVFHPDGGGQTFEQPNGNSGSEYYISGHLPVADVGQHSLAELLLVLPNVTLEVCIEINRSLNIPLSSGAPPQENGSANYFTKFTGAYGSNAPINATEFTRQPSGCFEGDTLPSAGTYHFYHTLMPR